MLASVSLVKEFMGVLVDQNGAGFGSRKPRNDGDCASGGTPECTSRDHLVADFNPGILEWGFATRFRPNPTQRRIWNGFARKFGWRDLASPFLETVKREEGFADRDDLVTAFDIIDAREGRSPGRKVTET